MKKIVLTGGGTAGHVTPNLALLPKLKEEGFEIYYIGSHQGIEKQLVESYNIPYYGISSGKLRRYFDLKNFSDFFRVFKGFLEVRKILKKIKPDIVFSKGGFVTVPVVIAAKKLGIKAIIHESDMTPGLANRLCLSSAHKICCNFPETAHHLPDGKFVLTGSPIREELFNGDKNKGLKFTGLSLFKPTILVTGGSLGAVAINNAVRAILPTLLEKYQVIHLCGKDHLAPNLENLDGYVQYEYIKDELPDLLACADFVISRAGANTICELLALKKPTILIPLPAKSSRGDQLLNSKSFEKQGFSYLIEEEKLTDNTLLEAIDYVTKHKKDYIAKMDTTASNNSINLIINEINKALNH